MALFATHNNSKFGVGDRIKVFQRIKEGEKNRLQVFEGMVIGISGKEENKSFTVRRIGEAQVGIERIFPLFAPTIEKIEVLKKGTQGVRHSKLYFTRDQSRREIAKIYSRVGTKKQ